MKRAGSYARHGISRGGIASAGRDLCASSGRRLGAAARRRAGAHRAAGLCHTDLEVIEGQLAYPDADRARPRGRGHRRRRRRGRFFAAARRPVVLSWNPHCGTCFIASSDQPILCETYRRLGPQAVPFDGTTRLARGGEPLRSHVRLARSPNTAIVPAERACACRRRCRSTALA